MSELSEQEKKQKRREIKKRRRKRKRQSRWRKLIGNLTFIVALIVFAVSAYKLYGIFSEYYKGDREYVGIQDVVITQGKSEDGQEEIFKIDFDVLREINPDVVGWIRFEEPSVINYPVVKGEDNVKYLTQTIENSKNKCGTLFVDAENAGDFTDKNTFIYGHNMKNGSMFAQLMKYKEESFCKQYPYFYIYTPNGMVSKYQIFSVGVVKDTSDSYIKVYADDAAYQQYIDAEKQQSVYETGVEVTAQSQIVSLSTCTNVRDDERFLVHGVKISEEPVE